MATKNKIALVTGGSRGLGKNMALRLAQQGYQVLITYKSNKEEAEKVITAILEMGTSGAAFQLDTADTKAFDTFFATLSNYLEKDNGNGRFDFLVNNAGIDRRALIAQTTEEEFDELFQVHLKGVYFLTQKALPFINDHGRIINLSTGLARFVTPGYAAYAAMKGGIEVFTRYLAKEVGSRGITANVVAPGIIETDFTRSVFEHAPEAIAHIKSQTALGRTGVPDDIGGIVTFLCTEEACWITAQRIEASGGMFL
ncbi:NAD(P)-dependent dehydrogenase (short-subunit alcohol dehydrogenase family) [Chitinophaga polysaccharea]|uniref:NAD(P)-dependent dehydrogenase (Short-subunit alcohol dehydrogenase family) n=1 Tax=Chitinophaga polysaccharea TaxID=1293035 RepID=A0A561PT99_9BACT|nr:SDR family oxidoreductase [Chitinophaga polysaccharea]TWF41298.1 NAD(P)-dependent dehydrogenase (short-subunit alcohol dehydrogenase family) [Chitinophaga polysaccharea]